MSLRHHMPRPTQEQGPYRVRIGDHWVSSQAPLPVFDPKLELETIIQLNWLKFPHAFPPSSRLEAGKMTIYSRLAVTVVAA